MTSTHALRADWYSPPGQTISDVLQHRKISHEEFANHMSLTSDELWRLLEGVDTITDELADRLSRELGSTPQFWLAREAQYRADRARLQKPAPTADEKQWLRELPISDMVRFGWLRAANSVSERVEACLQFFEVTSIEEWRSKAEVSAAFRTSPKFKSELGAVAAWLRQGEIQAATIQCARWDREKLKAVLPTLRTLTRKKEPVAFLPELTAKCAECGVAVVIVRAPKGCHTSGATRFISKHKALLMLSFRHLSDDQFWFTFFHEVGHLILHKTKSVFVEWEDVPSSKEEREANEYAANTLVHPDVREAMLALPSEAKAIVRFALQIQVSPGIVVGQLQHHGRLRYNQLNTLKRRFRWE